MIVLVFFLRAVIKFSLCIEMRPEQYWHSLDLQIRYHFKDVYLPLSELSTTSFVILIALNYHVFCMEIFCGFNHASFTCVVRKTRIKLLDLL